MTLLTVIAAALPWVLLHAEPLPSQIQNGVQLASETTKIRIRIGSRSLTATLHDNVTAKDFATLLPLKIKLKDHASTEKVGDLPRKLSTIGAPKGSDPDVGDIGYYAPWGNLALYHEDFEYSAGLVKLGRIDSGIEILKTPGPLNATIELVGK